MQKITRFSLLLMLVMFALSCGNSGKKEKDGTLNDKKTQLQKLQNDRTTLDEKIKSLQTDIDNLDTGANNEKVKLVSVMPVSAQNFQHFIDLQGRVDAENISYISPRGMGGQVRAIYVKKGDNVKKGELLLKLDDAISRQQVVTARQSMGGVKAQLSLAESVYDRQKNLWDQHIGTEVQLLQSKTNVESLQNQLKTMEENVRLAQEQVNLSNVYSDVNGVADEVNIHVGEMFTGAPGMGIKIINTSSLKVVTDIPENYLSHVKQGTKVQVVVPDVNKTYNASISLISQSVSSTSRGFTAEIKIPYDNVLKPGQSAQVKILDYSAANGIVIPINLVQSDEKGKYVYVLEKQSNGKSIARKKQVVIGEVYEENVEIKSGLTAGEQLISEGYQSLYEGQGVTTEVK